MLKWWTNMLETRRELRDSQDVPIAFTYMIGVVTGGVGALAFYTLWEFALAVRSAVGIPKPVPLANWFDVGALGLFVIIGIAWLWLLVPPMVGYIRRVGGQQDAGE